MPMIGQPAPQFAAQVIFDTGETFGVSLKDSEDLQSSKLCLTSSITGDIYFASQKQ